jgi:hypothetical protein
MYSEYDEVNLQNDKCLQIFYKWAKRGRIVGQIKEKYHTTRWYAQLGPYFTWNDVFYPCHYYIKTPKWLRRLDFVFLPFLPLIGKWRVYCYKNAYKECLKKYPLARHAIDYKELIK